MKKLILIFVMLVFVGQAWGVSSPDKVADAYIQAQKNRDYKKLFNLDYMESLARKVYGSKSIKSGRDYYMEERLPIVMKEKAYPAYFPASMKYKILDVIKNTAGYNYYEKYKNWIIYSVVIEVSYPNKSESPDQEGQLIKKGVIGLSIDGKSGTVIESNVIKSKIIESYGISPSEAKRKREEQAAKTEQENQKKAYEKEVLKANQERKAAKKATEGVLTDPNGLMWAKDADVSEEPMNWDNATNWVSKLNYGGYNDWRLPTKEELGFFARQGGESAYHYYNTNGFLNVKPSWYWSSNNNDDRAWGVYMDGEYIDESADKSDKYYVWPVRGKISNIPAPIKTRKAKKSKSAIQRESAAE